MGSPAGFLIIIVLRSWITELEGNLDPTIRASLEPSRASGMVKVATHQTVNSDGELQTRRTVFLAHK